MEMVQQLERLEGPTPTGIQALMWGRLLAPHVLARTWRVTDYLGSRRIRKPQVAAGYDLSALPDADLNSVRLVAPRAALLPIEDQPTPSKWPKFEPMAMLEVEISQPLPTLPAIQAKTGRRYRRAQALVRLHTRPLGLVELPVWEAGVSADQLALTIWEALGSQINAHLEDEGLPLVQELTSEGLLCEGAPPCLEARQTFLLNAPFVSVVIPTRDRPQQVVTLVRSILASEYPASCYEVIVVDNAPSTNDTAQVMHQTFGDDAAQVRYVREDHPGTSNARNCGVAVARSDIVVFVDDDVVVDSSWLTEMAMGFQASENVGCVTGLIVPLEIDTPPQEWFEQFGGFCKMGMNRCAFNLTDYRADSPLYPYNVGIYGAGASMAFKRSVLRDMQGFDPALGPGTPAKGGEDIDAMLRVLFKGHTLLYQPAALAHHRARNEYAQLRKQMYGYGAGLTACLFKAIVTRPERLVDFISKLPRGLAYAFSPVSARHAKKRPDYPLELTWLEFTGLLCGPLAYLLGRRRAKRSAPNITTRYVEPQAVPASRAH